MKDNKDKKKQNTKNNQLIQVAVVCLATVSLFTTAQGMSKYIFKNGPISYAASAAIQGILLAMSMGLPAYLRGVWEKQWDIIRRGFLCLFILLLTGVALFCSSWFSYIYIAEIIHFDSWHIDSELLVQQTYRSELYEARDYAHSYRVYLENSLGEKILELENMADELSENEQLDTLNMNWQEERESYEGMDTVVGNYMLTVIDFMESAMEIDSSQNSREQAARAIEDAESNINSRKESVSQQLESNSEKINTYNAEITALRRQITNATEGTDTTSLESALNNTIASLQSETEKRNSYEREYEQLNDAISRLQIYETYLGLNNSTSTIAIKGQLLVMQTEFFADDPDEEALLDTATSVFTSLRNAATYEKNEDKLSYSNLLVQMNQLILNLKDYSAIKETEKQLEGYINEFASDNVDMVNEDWKEYWQDQLETLKSSISAMPMYIATGASVNRESSLTDSQRELLQSYSRDEACKRVDDVIRFYIAEHNALYQGIIYLNSPYNELAWFAIVLAFSFDISGFILGFVNQGETEDTEAGGEEKNRYGRTDNAVAWSILPTLNKYRILTGDFEKIDGIYHYQVFEDGVLQQWNVKDTVSYKQGIYVQDLEVEMKGAQVPETQQEILFHGQAGGPQDGVYISCSLKFDEGSLLLVEEVNGDKSERFLANLYEYVPVHSYSCSRGECRTIPVQDLKKDYFVVRMAVLALNDKGSRIAAIYVVVE